MEVTSETRQLHLVSVRERVWVRTPQPIWGFWWRGLLPLLGLLAVLLFGLTRFARSWIERRVEAQTAAQLAEKGYGWVRVAADGQNVRLRGVLPPGADPTAPIAYAEHTLCPTWLGDKDCTRHVTAAFDAPPPPPVPARALRWHDVTLTSTATTGGVTVVARGEVPDEGARNRVLHALRGSGRFSEVKDELTLVAEPPMRGWDDLAVRAVGALPLCEQGEARILQGVFSLRCEVSLVNKPKIATLAQAPVSQGTLGDIVLVAKEEAAACDKQFAALLQRSTVEFDTNSVAIRPTSTALLTKVAEIAKGCPGNVRIEGHTDSTGKPEANLALSRGRAESVRNALVALGVAPTRLLADGFGAAQPKADNATPLGRAQNRRIEFHITTASR